MYRSAGNPHVAAAKANIWSQSTQEVLDSWNPFDEEAAEKKARYQEELDSLDRRRGELVDGIDDPRRRKQDAELKADKNQIKKLHETVVFYKTESDRKRRLEKRGGHPPDHYMQGLPIRQGDGTPPSPGSELESPVQPAPPPRSRFPFSLFGRRKNPNVTPMYGPRPASFDDASPRQPIAMMREPHSHDSRLEPTVSRTGHNTFPGRHQDRRRDAYDERIPSKLSHDKYSSRPRDRHGDEYRRRDDRERYPSTSHRDDKYSRSRDVAGDQPSSAHRRHDKDRPRNGDEHYPSRHRSSRRRHYSEDAGDSADPEARERRRHRHRDRGEYEDSSRHRRHRSDGHYKSRSGKGEREHEPSHSQNQEEGEGPPEGHGAEEGGEGHSVSEQLHGSMEVGGN